MPIHNLGQLKQPLSGQSESILLKDIVESLGISNSKMHLTESTYRKVLEMFSIGVKNKEKYFQKTLKVYHMTVETFPNLTDWENAPIEEKIIRYTTKTNIDYYYTMVLCGRIMVDWAVLNSHLFMPPILFRTEIEKLEPIFESYRYKSTARQNVLQFLQKMMYVTHKEWHQIDEEDIYRYRSLVVRPEFARSTFYVLQALGNISKKKTYVFAGILTQRRVFLENEHKEIIKIYQEFLDDIENRYVKNTKEKVESKARNFLNWLWNSKSEISSPMQFTFGILKDYAIFLREYVSQRYNKPLSKKEVVVHLSYLKKLLFFLSRKKYITDEFATSLKDYNKKLYPRGYKGRIFPYPVPMKDRLEIEKIIYEGYPANPIVEKMLKLMYLMGLRPVETISLKLDCVRGNKKVPMLHIHKAKNYKQRQIPMPEEVRQLVSELQANNADSVPIHYDYDGETHQRLFAYRGILIRRDSVGDIFKDLQIKHGLVDFKGEAKYSLYILRKIRITMWLESGISEDEVAYLAGHGNVDSHNFYLVGKESRMKNSQKVFETYYKDFFEQLKETGKYTPPSKQEEEKNRKSYLEELEQTLLQIESKNINFLALESIVKNMPELTFPVQCGQCFAMAVLNDDFECERMQFPCLECAELVDAENFMEEFDNYVKRLYDQRHLHAKNGLDGLLVRDDSILSRLKLFYSRKFKMSDDQIETHFENYRKLSIPKRGRKKKTTMEDGVTL